MDYNDGNIVNGEIYISIDTVKRNATNYKVSLRNEIVKSNDYMEFFILCGYDDRLKQEKEEMREDRRYMA
ncbi:MAG: rRNA maturation RNAse YbeY [Marinilabiliales bacterium]|nr:rRNA maturation RNAse YbeY [Marinilabiliales bacterium]